MSHEPLSDAYKKAYDAVMKDLRAVEFAPMPFPFYEGIPPKPTGFSVAEPEKVKQDTCVVGYRNWHLLFVGEQQVLLRSMNFVSYVWPPGEAAKGELQNGHGLHAYTALKQARDTAFNIAVFGHVKLWGTVYEHSDGILRGEHGYPTKLFVRKRGLKNAKNIAQMLARAYGCDVVVGDD
jgi:hypothetical protein